MPAKPSQPVQLLQLLRPRQWTKNLVVYAGVIFSGNLLRPHLAARATAGVVAFIFASAAVYVFNDLRDRGLDREHPRKRERPLASGAVEPWQAGLLMAAALAGALGLALRLGSPFALTLTLYVLLNLAYTLDLNRRVILDVFSLAGGFVLRAAAGAVLVGVPVSPWLWLTTALLALFLGFSKRRHELLLLEEGAVNHRPVLGEYSTMLLDQLIAVVTASTLVAYALYSFTVHSPHFMLTIPFVAYGLFRYLYLVYRRDLGGSPESILLSDPPTILNLLLWAAAVVILLYLGPRAA